MESVPALAQPIKAAAPTAPRPRPRPNPRRKSEPTPQPLSREERRQRCRYQIWRDSALNQHAHEILIQAHELIAAIDRLEDSDAEGELFETLEAGDFDGTLIGTLGEVLPHASGARYFLQLFAEVLNSMLVPTVEQAAEMRAEARVLAETAAAPRRSR